MLCQVRLTFNPGIRFIRTDEPETICTVRLTLRSHCAYDSQVKLTPPIPDCQVYLTEVPHYLVPDAAAYLGVSERQIYRWFDDKDVALTKRHYPDPDSKGICVAAAEVHALDEQRQEERADAQRTAA